MLLFNRLFHQQIMFFCLIKAIQIQHIMNSSLSSLSLLPQISALRINTRHESQILNLLRKFFHLLIVNLIIESNLRINELNFTWIFIRSFILLRPMVDLRFQSVISLLLLLNHSFLLIRLSISVVSFNSRFLEKSFSIVQVNVKYCVWLRFFFNFIQLPLLHLNKFLL